MADMTARRIRDLIMKRVGQLIRWAVVKTAGTDAGNYPTQELSYNGRPARNSAVWYPYGFHAVAEAGSMALLLYAGGQPDARVHLSGSPRERPRINAGEVVVYCPVTGAKVHFRKNGDIDITSPADVNVNALNVNATATTKATVTAPDIDLTGDVNITGALTVSGILNANGVLNANNDLNDQNGIEMSIHRHTETNGGSTFDTGLPKV